MEIKQRFDALLSIVPGQIQKECEKIINDSIERKMGAHAYTLNLYIEKYFTLTKDRLMEIFNKLASLAVKEREWDVVKEVCIDFIESRYNYIQKEYGVNTAWKNAMSLSEEKLSTFRANILAEVDTFIEGRKAFIKEEKKKWTRSIKFEILKILLTSLCGGIAGAIVSYYIKCPVK